MMTVIKIALLVLAVCLVLGFIALAALEIDRLKWGAAKPFKKKIKDFLNNDK